MYRLDGKVAFVTGAASGIGAATARMMAQVGARLAVTDVDVEGAQAVVKSILESGGIAAAYHTDVLDRGSIEASLDQASTELGAVDVLVSNAGGSFGVPATRFIEEVADADFDLVVRRNLHAAFYVCRSVAPGMRSRGWGRIVIVSSGAGRAHSRTYTGRLQYASSKAGQLGFTRQLAVEMAPFGVTVNSVAPGLIRTSDRLEQGWMGQTEEEREAFLRTVPVGRRGDAEEVAAAILFLASREASYITGHCIDVNGGGHMH